MHDSAAREQPHLSKISIVVHLQVVKNYWKRQKTVWTASWGMDENNIFLFELETSLEKEKLYTSFHTLSLL